MGVGIVADIMSAPMRQYALEYGISESFQVFALRYEKAYTRDLELLKSIFFQGYQNYVTRYPNEKYVTTCLANSAKSVFNLKRREILTLDSYDKIFSNDKWIEVYCKIRNMEENDALHPTKVAKIIRNAKFYNFSVDISESMRYINEQFRSTFKSKPGGVNWLKGWMTKREEERRLED